GVLFPNWSFALYQLGYYSEAKQAAALADDWEERADALRAIQAQCAQAGFTVCSLTASIERLLAERLAEAYDALANDPPDADFAAVAIPEIAVSSGRLFEISPSLAESWKALFGNQARTAALIEAFVTANERGQGATLAGNDQWARTHAQFAALYASELARLAQQHTGLAQSAIARWYDEGLAGVALPDGMIYPDVLGGLGIGMRTQQFAASMALLSEGNM